MAVTREVVDFASCHYETRHAAMDVFEAWEDDVTGLTEAYYVELKKVTQTDVRAAIREACKLRGVQ